MNRNEFAALCSRTVLLDGATGSNLMKKGMPRNVCTEAWILEHGEPLIELQQAYIEAGSDIIYAPTFSANRISLGKHGMADRVRELNTGLVALSRKAAAGSSALIAGDMTTTGELVEPLGEVTEEELFEAYREQAQALYDAGVDLFIAETLLSVLEAKTALRAVRSVCDLPFMCTLTVMEDGKAYFGGSAAELAEELPALGADAVGINCSAGPDRMLDVVKDITARAKVPVIVKLNAGSPIPDAAGNMTYPMQAEAYAEEMKKILALGAGLVGGCCGTTPEYIRKMKELITHV